MGETDPVKFVVHKEFVFHSSPVLKAALSNPNFVEAQTQTYRLDDTTEGAFRLLVQWLYTQKLELLQMRQDFDVEANEGMEGEEDQSLVELWVLADKIDMPELQNLALRSIDKLSHVFSRIASGFFTYVYENTNEDSLLRRYFVAQCSHFIPTGGFKEHAGNYPHEMLIDIAEFSAARFKVLEDDGEEEAFDLNKCMVPVEKPVKK